jgi:hypothetical protein
MRRNSVKRPYYIDQIHLHLLFTLGSSVNVSIGHTVNL